MQQTYLVIATKGHFVGGDYIAKDEPLEVSREVRNRMLTERVARDATDEEIEEIRGSAALEGDDGELAAALEAAQTQLAALEGERKALQEKVTALEADNADLAAKLKDAQAAAKKAAKGAE